MLFLYDLVKDSLHTYALYVERQLMGSDTPLVTLLLRLFFLILLPIFIVVIAGGIFALLLLTWVVNST